MNVLVSWLLLGESRCETQVLVLVSESLPCFLLLELMKPVEQHCFVCSNSSLILASLPSLTLTLTDGADNVDTCLEHAIGSASCSQLQEEALASGPLEHSHTPPRRVPCSCHVKCHVVIIIGLVSSWFNVVLPDTLNCQTQTIIQLFPKHLLFSCFAKCRYQLIHLSFLWSCPQRVHKILESSPLHQREEDRESIQAD